MAVRACAAGALGALAFGLSGCGSSSATTTLTTTSDPCDAEWRANLFNSTPPHDFQPAPTLEAHAEAVQTLNIDDVIADLQTRLTDSHPCWPADFGNYGPLFVRLAWHCSGSYRESDGVGGCGGGRQRFEPERSWDDNTNLDKARALLNPIKAKYGDALSWGDLIVAAGTTALRSMGAPITQLCFGRIDDQDGARSLDLGPSQEQQEVAPCEVNGACTSPLGSTTVGLIYVNPEGPVDQEGGTPDPSPSRSVEGVRDTFERMGHSDRATVALIGGGHAIGKVHGACPSGPGRAPAETFADDPNGVTMPWVGECGGNGKGPNTFTSGFEGQWTSTPLQWSNKFFKDLLHEEWEVWDGPGGHKQWRIASGNESVGHLMRLTTDMSLLEDEHYRSLVEEYASDMDVFNRDFDDAWSELTIVKGSGRWSVEAKCDHGQIPTSAQMLDSDIGISV